MVPASAMMFVSLPSYPPRGQSTHVAQERVPAQLLSLPHPSSTVSSRDTNKGLRNPWGASQDPTLSHLGSLSGAAATVTQYPAHSQEQPLQLLDVADIDADVITDELDHTDLESLGSWRLATACVAAALPIPDTGGPTQDAAMPEDNRAISPTTLDRIADPGFGIHSSCCWSLLETFGSCGSLMSLGSIEQPAELMDLTPGVFAAMAAGLASDQPPTTPLQGLASCGSDLALAVYEALTEVPATAVAQPTPQPINRLQDVEGPVCDTSVQQEVDPTPWANADRKIDAPMPGLPLGARWVSCEGSLPGLQDTPPALSSSDCSGESCPALPAVSSDISDARSAPLHPQQLVQHRSQATPLPQAAGPAAVPNLAMDQEGATMALAGSLSTSAGPDLVRNISSGRRRRTRAREAATSARALRNREHQKQYEARKRARDNVTLSLAEGLEKHVESMELEIEALRARQYELLEAQELFTAPNRVSIVDLVSVVGLSNVDATPNTTADTETTYWTQFAAEVGLTTAQEGVLVNLLTGLASELEALTAERHVLDKELAQALKAADSETIADSTLRIKRNHEVTLELQARFARASHKVLTEGQRKKLSGDGGTIPQPAQMQVLCRALCTESRGT